MSLKLEANTSGVEFNNDGKLNATVAFWYRNPVQQAGPDHFVGGAYNSFNAIQDYPGYPAGLATGSRTVPDPPVPIAQFEWVYIVLFQYATDRWKEFFILRDAPDSNQEFLCPPGYSYGITLRVVLGKSGSYAYLNGIPGAQYCCVRVWDRTLTLEETRAEQASKTPVSAVNLINAAQLFNEFVSEVGVQPIESWPGGISFTTDLPILLSDTANEVIGGVTATEQLDGAAFAGAKTFFGTLGATEARDNAAFAGTRIPSFSTGTLGATEQRDVAAVAGDTSNPDAIGGGMSATEGFDTASFVGAKTYFGTLAVTEARDVAAFAGTMIPKLVTGSMALLEQLDDAEFFGDSFNPGAIGGSLRATESFDTAAFAGVKTFTGTLAATESRDTADFAGSRIPSFAAGTLAATEARDTAAFADAELPPEGDMSNTIVMRDGNSGIGISPETEWREGAPSWARAGSDGKTQFPMAIGLAPAEDNMTNNVLARQSQLLQAPGNTPAGSDVVPGWFTYRDVVAGEWCWCVSRTDQVADDDDPIGQPDLPAV